MHTIILIVHALALGAAAFPTLSTLDTREGIRHDEANSGFFPNQEFNAEDQFVDVTKGSGNEWKAPAEGDIRGPCPGLNAAANHAFLPRSGVLNLIDTVTGLKQAFNFGPDFAEPLAIFSIVVGGDLLTETWSIGGPQTGAKLNGLFGQPTGISYTHSRYEGDVSPTRGDAYLHDGDAYSLDMAQFQNLYDMGDHYTFAHLRQQLADNIAYSRANNPYFFSGPVSGVVPPIAHGFIPAMMSNHSKTQIQGHLSRSVLKQFFSITGPDDNLQWVPGHERIPLNWYKRPSSNLYSAQSSFGDLAISISQNPQVAQIGGNTGTPNSFVGVDVGDLTGGVFNAKTLLQGNNLGCLFFESLSAGLASQTTAALGATALKLLDSKLDPLRSKLGCPKLGKMNANLLKGYPGYNYHPAPPSK